MFNIIHNEAIIKVDFIIRKETLYHKIEFRRKKSIVFEGLKINVTSPEDLVISKLYWAKDSLSELQMRDVKNLLKTVSNLDMGYIEKWVKELGLLNIFQKVNE